MACSRVTSCPLFSLFTLNATMKLWRINYCDSHFDRCERFKLSTGGAKVPPDLLPNGKRLSVALDRTAAR